MFTLYRARGRFRASSSQWLVIVAQLALSRIKVHKPLVQIIFQKADIKKAERIAGKTSNHHLGFFVLGDFFAFEITATIYSSISSALHFVLGQRMTRFPLWNFL